MPAEDHAIRPFPVSFPDTELTELRRRVAATRWPERETVTDDSQGVPLAMMQDLAPRRTRLRAAEHLLRPAPGLRADHVHPSADPVRPGPVRQRDAGLVPLAALRT